MTGVSVLLDPAEVAMANIVACMRQGQNLAQGRRDAFGASIDEATGMRLHLEGCAGELAVAKHLGRYWNGNLGRLRAADVGKLQVRTTTYERGCLLLHSSDADQDAFILVVGSAPRLRLVGWLRGVEGKVKEFWRDPGTGRPAFMVPQDRLRPMPQGQSGASPENERGPVRGADRASVTRRTVAT